MEHAQARNIFNRQLFSTGRKLKLSQQRLYHLTNKELKDFFCSAFYYYNNFKHCMSLAEKQKGLKIISKYISLFGDDFLERYDIANIATEYNNFFKLVNKIDDKVIDELNERRLDFLFLEMNNYFNTFFRGPYYPTEQDIANQNTVALFPRLFFLISSKHLLEQFVELDKLFVNFDTNYNLRTIATDQQIIDFYRRSLDYYEQYKNLICSEDKNLILQRLGQISSCFRDQEHIGDGVERFVDEHDFSFSGVEKVNFFRLLNFIQIPALKGELSEEEVSASLDDISSYLRAYNSQQVDSAEQITTFSQLYSIVMRYKEKHSITKTIDAIEKGLKILKSTEASKTVKITTFLDILCYIGEAFTTNNMSSSSREFIQKTSTDSFQKLKDIKKFVDKLVKPDKHPFSINELADALFRDEEFYRALDIYISSSFKNKIIPYFDLTIGAMEAIKEVFLSLKFKLREISSTVNGLVQYYYDKQKKSTHQDVTSDSAFVHCIKVISVNDKETLSAKYKSSKLKTDKKNLEQRLEQNYQSKHEKEKKLHNLKEELEKRELEISSIKKIISESEEQINEQKTALSTVNEKLKHINADTRFHKKSGQKIPTKLSHEKQNLQIQRQKILKKLKSLHANKKEKYEEQLDLEKISNTLKKTIRNQEEKLKELLDKLKDNQEELKVIHSKYQDIRTEIYNFHQAKLNMGKFIFEQVKLLLDEELWQKIFESEYFSDDIAFIIHDDESSRIIRVPSSYAKQNLGDIPFSVLPGNMSKDLYIRLLQDRTLQEYNTVWDALESKVAAEELSIEYYLLSFYQLFEDVVKDTHMHLQFRGLRHFYRHDSYNFYALNKRYNTDDKQHKIDMTIHYLIAWVKTIKNHSLLNFLLNDNTENLANALDSALKMENKFYVSKLLESGATPKELTCGDQKIKFMLFTAQQISHDQIPESEYSKLIKLLFCLYSEDTSNYHNTEEIKIDEPESESFSDVFTDIVSGKLAEATSALKRLKLGQENIRKIAQIITTAYIICANKFEDETEQEVFEKKITAMIKKFPDTEVIAEQEEKVELDDVAIQSACTSVELSITPEEYELPTENVIPLAGQVVEVY